MRATPNRQAAEPNAEGVQRDTQEPSPIARPPAPIAAAPSTLLGGLTPQPAPQASAPSAVPADDHLPALPDELLAYLTSFAPPGDAAARPSSTGHRLRDTLHDQKLSARYGIDAQGVLSIDEFNDLFEKIAQLPRNLRREPLTALLEAATNKFAYDEIFTAFCGISDAAKTLPPADQLALLVPLAETLDALPPQAKQLACEDLLSQAELAVRHGCPESWGKFSLPILTQQAKSEDPLFIIGTHLATYMNWQALETVDKLSSVVSQLPPGQQGLATGMVAVLYQYPGTLLPAERSAQFADSVDELLDLPPEQQAIALTVMSSIVKKTHEPVDFALRKLFPAIAALEAEHRALPLTLTTELVIERLRSDKAPPQERLRMFDVLCAHVTQLPSAQQEPIWIAMFELLSQVPRAKRSGAVKQLMATIDRADERHQADLRERVSSEFLN